MLSSIGIIIVGVIIALFELPHLKKEKANKEMCIFLVLLMIGTTLSILLALNIDIPNPIDWLMVIFFPVSNWIETLLS